MIKKISMVWMVLIVGLATAIGQKINIPRVIADAETQTRLMLTEILKAKNNSPSLVSPHVLKKGKLELVPSGGWTSGFFPGELWYLYELTGKKTWESEARKFTANIEKEKFNDGTNDMGFKIYCSFGNGYRLTNDAHYKDVIIQSAKTLATRFNPKAGVIRSWDSYKNKWDYPVNIDNMMNLEILFEATKLKGDSSFYNIAVSHANQTLKNHFRPDFSSYHVVDYDTITSQVIKKTTHQGYCDQSAWARGQAWGLYGYVMCYRETRNKAYLQQAEHIASFILHNPNMPPDLVPFWDLDAPHVTDEPRDASAAAITASALYELSTYGKSNKKYKLTADKIIKSLTDNYRSPLGQNKGFILLHSTGSKPSNSEIDVPIIYADYYFLESLLRKKKLDAGKKLLN
ncbi:MAG: glycoside hydrolase family 88 protein [Ginsengibacter sp.]